MAVINSPEASFTGVSAGVNFTNGAGQTDDEAVIGYFEQAGYAVVRDEPEKPEPEQKPEPEKKAEPLEVPAYTSKTEELVAYARSVGIEAGDDAKKPDVWALIKAHLDKAD